MVNRVLSADNCEVYYGPAEVCDRIVELSQGTDGDRDCAEWHRLSTYVQAKFELAKAKDTNGHTDHPYPDEPYPDDEYQWKRWWIMKFFDPDQPLYLGDLQWVHACWKETKARWHAPHSDERDTTPTK